MSLLDRMSDSFARFIDRNLLEQRAERSPGYNLAMPNWTQDKPRWLDNNMISYRQAFASQTAVYRCVMARAGGVATATLRVYRETDGDRTEEPNHPLRLLMQQPNPLMSEAEWLVMTQTLMDATGFCAIEKVRAASGAPVQLWHLRSDWLREIRRNQQPSDWEYRIPGREPMVIRADDVIVVPGGPSTDLGTIGMSPIAVALREVGIDAAMTDFLKMFIDQGGTPAQALVTPNTPRDQAEAEYLIGLFRQAYGGWKNWTKTALLAGGMDVKKIGLSLDEMAYPELRALTETHICSVFGVPAIIAGIQAGLDASTYSNYQQARKAFFEDTISYLWTRLDGALTRGLLPEFGGDGSLSLEFDTSAVPALREDQNALWQRVQGMLGTGAMTVNQAQQAIGLPGFGEAGDVLYLPINLQPTRPDDLSIMADMTAEPPQPIPAALSSSDGNGQEDSISAGDGVDQSGAASRDAVAGALGSVVLPNVAGVGIGDRTGRADAPYVESVSELSAGRIRLVTLPIETRANVARNGRRNQNRLTAKFAPRLSAMFRRQGEVVASAYAKRGADVPEKRAMEQIPWDDLDAEMERELLGLYEAAGKMAFGSASALLDSAIDWTLVNPRIRQTMIQLARRIVGINQTTREDVRRVIVAGQEEGLTVQQIADNLRGLYTETYKNRSLAIARTESQVSYNLGTADAYRESGVVQAMMLHDNPNHTDDYGALDGLSCAQRDGVITDVDRVDVHVFSEHTNGSLAVSPLLVRPLGAA